MAGGAGGTCCAGAGGYTGGTGDSQHVTAHNGLAGADGVHCSGELLGGGGYLQGAKGISVNSIDRASKAFGGFGNQGHWNNLSDKSGSGGAGGTVNVSENAKVYAYNGNRFTDGTSYLKGENQCPIYLQAGKKIAIYEYKSENTPLFNHFTLIEKSAAGIAGTSGYVNTAVNKTLTIPGNSYFQNIDMSTQGVGSGAGFKETSNGKYKIDVALNEVPEGL